MVSSLKSARSLDPRANIAICKCLSSPERRLNFSKKVVLAKARSQLVTLKKFRSNYKAPEIASGIRKIKAELNSIKEAKDVDELRGLEGLTARYYFAVFPTFLRADWVNFTGRNRRPPRDPVNALLSYIYAVLTREIQCLLEAFSIDSALGIYHVPEKGRPSLALDLVEPFRSALVDILVCKLVNLGVVGEDDFKYSICSDSACFLAGSAKNEVFKKMEKWWRDYDVNDPFFPNGASIKLIEEEISRFASLARNERLDDFEPFCFDA